MFQLDIPGAKAIGQAIVSAITQAIASFINQLSQQLTAAFSSQKIVLQTGAGVSYALPVVIRFWQMSVTTVDLALAIVILWIAYNTMLGVYEPLKMLSRVALAAIGAHASLQFAGLFIELNNALCKDALAVAQTPTTLDIVALFGLPVLGGRGVVDFLFQDLFIRILADMVTFQMIVRMGILDLILTILPFFALLLVLPETQSIAQLGLSAFVAVVFLQFLQVLAIALGSTLVTSLAATLSVTSTFAGIAILFFVLRIPGWIGGAIGSYINSIRSPI
jgi:hypothetical protein